MTSPLLASSAPSTRTAQVGRYYITFCVKSAPSQSYYHVFELPIYEEFCTQLETEITGIDIIEFEPPNFQLHVYTIGK